MPELLKLSFHAERNAAFLARAVAAAYEPAGPARQAWLAELDHEDVTEIAGDGPHDVALLFKSGESTALAVRGSPSPISLEGLPTWFSNANLRLTPAGALIPRAAGKVHSGFRAAAAGLLDRVRAELRGAYGGRPLYIAGHSRGAAVAGLLARALVAEAPFDAAPPMVHMIAPPRCGDVAFYADWQNSPLTHNTWLWANAGDPVPQLPTRQQGYCHVEKQWLLYPNGDQDYGDLDEAGAGPAFRFTLAQLLRALAGQFRPSDLRTHALGSYLAKFDRLA